MPDPDSLLGDTARIIGNVNYAHCTTAYQSGHVDDHANHHAHTANANFYIYTHHDRRQAFADSDSHAHHRPECNGHAYQRNQHPRSDHDSDCHAKIWRLCIRLYLG